MKASNKYWTGNKECGFTYQWHLVECVHDMCKECAPDYRRDKWGFYFFDNDTGFGDFGLPHPIKIRYKTYMFGGDKYFRLEVKQDNGRYIDIREYDWEIEE